MAEKGIEPFLTADELAQFGALNTPYKIQEFFDSIPYNSADPSYHSPLTVLREGKAHCFDGALFGAAALRSLNFRSEEHTSELQSRLHLGCRLFLRKIGKH